MASQTLGSSPRRRARIAGVFYLLTILTGGFAAFAGPGLARYGAAANLMASGCYIVVTLLFYGLFKAVSSLLSLLAAMFSLVGCALGALTAFHLVRLPVNNLVFFGAYCLLIGYLILRSAFLPRILGALMGFGGLGWLTFLSPPLANQFAPYNMAPGILGELSLTVWLLAIGVNEKRWREQASAAGMRA